MGRPQTSIATWSQAVARAALVLLLVAGCTSGIDLLGDGDHDVVPPADADGAADADADADDGDVDVLAESEDSCCGPDDPMVAACQDGLWCNGREQVDCLCECVPPSSDLIDCDDGDSATVDWCDETMDVCRHSDDGGDAGADAEADSGTCAGGWFDPSSGLCWENPPDETVRIWGDAVVYCDDVVLGGRDDWHLPTIDELRSLFRGCPGTVTGGSCRVAATCLAPECYDEACTECFGEDGPGFGGAFWPDGLGGVVDQYWSLSHPEATTVAWYVGFEGGYVSLGPRYLALLARCVRPGP